MWAKFEYVFKTFWRPAMAWQYLIVCLADFIFLPIFHEVMNPHTDTPWQPITLQGSGIYHLSMGAIVGVTSWSRGMEKIRELQMGPVPPPTTRTTIEETDEGTTTTVEENE